MRKKALFVGVNRYERMQPLKYCCGDAQALYDLFNEVGGYEEVKLLTDPDLSSLRKTVEGMVVGMSPGDFLFLYFSGHGYTDAGRHLLLCTDDIVTNLRYGICGIPFDYLRGLAADRLVNAAFVLDSCRSDFLSEGKRGKGTINNGALKDFLIGAQGEPSVSVMRACGQYQSAYETDKICHGRFTYAFLKTVKRLTQYGLPVLFNQGLCDAVTKELLAIEMPPGQTEEQRPEFMISGQQQELFAGQEGVKNNSMDIPLHAHDCHGQDEQMRQNLKRNSATVVLDARDVESLDELKVRRNSQEEDVANYKNFLVAAESGDVKAQYQMGKCYAAGRGCTKNEGKALEWYLKAASNGSADAQYSLGRVYEFGEGVNKDFKRAARWYRAAAKQNHVRSLFRLGLMYAQGRGCRRDATKTILYWTKAAKLGYALAQYDLGLMYISGKEVPKDPKKAVSLFSAAAQGGTLMRNVIWGICMSLVRVWHVI